MFDKLIVSDEQGAEFKGRSRYFMVSTVVVGILFVTALVFSLYAADIGLGNDEFEVSMMIAPVPPDAPEPPKPLQQRDEPQKHSDVPTRVSNMLRPDEIPLKAPTEISVTQKLRPSHGPREDFSLGGSTVLVLELLNRMNRDLYETEPARPQQMNPWQTL